MVYFSIVIHSEAHTFEIQELEISHNPWELLEKVSNLIVNILTQPITCSHVPLTFFNIYKSSTNTLNILSQLLLHLSSKILSSEAAPSLHLLELVEDTQDLIKETLLSVELKALFEQKTPSIKESKVFPLSPSTLKETNIQKEYSYVCSDDRHCLLGLNEEASLSQTNTSITLSEDLEIFSTSPLSLSELEKFNMLEECAHFSFDDLPCTPSLNKEAPLSQTNTSVTLSEELEVFPTSPLSELEEFNIPEDWPHFSFDDLPYLSGLNKEVPLSQINTSATLPEDLGSLPLPSLFSSELKQINMLEAHSYFSFDDLHCTPKLNKEAPTSQSNTSLTLSEALEVLPKSPLSPSPLKQINMLEAHSYFSFDDLHCTPKLNKEAPTSQSNTPVILSEELEVLPSSSLFLSELEQDNMLEECVNFSFDDLLCTQELNKAAPTLQPNTSVTSSEKYNSDKTFLDPTNEPSISKISLKEVSPFHSSLHMDPQCIIDKTSDELLKQFNIVWEPTTELNKFETISVCIQKNQYINKIIIKKHHSRLNKKATSNQIDTVIGNINKLLYPKQKITLSILNTDLIVPPFIGLSNVLNIHLQLLFIIKILYAKISQAFFPPLTSLTNLQAFMTKISTKCLYALKTHPSPQILPLPLISSFSASDILSLDSLELLKKINFLPFNPVRSELHEFESFLFHPQNKPFFLHYFSISPTLLQKTDQSLNNHVTHLLKNINKYLQLSTKSLGNHTTYDLLIFSINSNISNILHKQIQALLLLKIIYATLQQAFPVNHPSLILLLEKIKSLTPETLNHTSEISTLLPKKDVKKVAPDSFTALDLILSPLSSHLNSNLSPWPENFNDFHTFQYISITKNQPNTTPPQFSIKKVSSYETFNNLWAYLEQLNQVMKSITNLQYSFYFQTEEKDFQLLSSNPRSNKSTVSYLLKIIYGKISTTFPTEIWALEKMQLLILSIQSQESLEQELLEISPSSDSHSLKRSAEATISSNKKSKPSN
ncbi:hypothetical protein CLAVI_001039 [Candidatus Clavichlamydia salmonicola]|uniref:hypothetical protein n=1 Tax=Candidatus Clavichlamydia salmonicola TaxID=469812 RepID=UPI001891101E|nr:hypothetical protein [Candidatus Clavichlamydia salmonicola]MBF5051394.1 hypothetical protein [Candidatus Clavichlamydia salmonicola]